MQAVDSLQKVGSHHSTHLLSGLTLRGFQGQAGVDACILEEGQDKPKFLHGLCLGELACMLCENSERDGQCCRTLRFLSDGTKHDFLLRFTRKAILVRSDFVRALIEPSRVVFLKNVTGNPTFDKFLAEFQSNVKAADRDDCAFGILMLEAIICAVVNVYSLRLQVIKTVAARLLDGIRWDQSEESVLQLYPLKKTVTSFMEGMRPLVHCLYGILHVEFDREVPCPSGQMGGPDGLQHERRRPRTYTQHSQDGSQHERDHQHLHTHHLQACTDFVPESDTMEQVLEHWHENAQEILADAIAINGNIEDTMHFLEASMSCTRNRLLMFELITAGGTLSMTLGSLICGIFGMNLKTDLEKTNGAFLITVIVIAVLAWSVVVMSTYFVTRSKRHYKENSAEFGNNKFFRSISKDDYVLNRCARLEEGCLPIADVDAVLQDLSKTALPENQIPQSNTRRHVKREVIGSFCSYDSSLAV